MKTKYFIAVLVAVVMIAIGGYFYPQAGQVIIDKGGDVFGAIGTRFPNGLSVGAGTPSPAVNALVVGSTTAKQILAILGGTCNLTTGNTTSAAQNGQSGTFAASTTKMHFCAATGVRPGDQVFVTIPSGVEAQASSSPLGGPGLLGGISLSGAFSTTSDIIGVALYNSMAVATGSYTQATTGVRYLIFR